MAATAAATSPAPGNARVKVTVPDKYTHWPDYFVSRALDPGLPRRPLRVGPRPAVFVPVGGRKKFVAVYNGGLDDRVYVLPQDDPAAGRLKGCAKTPKAAASREDRRRLLRDQAAQATRGGEFTFTNPTIPHPLGLGRDAARHPARRARDQPLRPDYSGDRSNPNVFYLRGVRSAVGNEGLLTLTATRNDPLTE
jgi:hypothetical protein